MHCPCVVLSVSTVHSQLLAPSALKDSFRKPDTLSDNDSFRLFGSLKSGDALDHDGPLVLPGSFHTSGTLLRFDSFKVDGALN